ncbi:S-adenosyl-L-methionine-dependent tRNA 4-demethylwyosine synthase [Fulvia fulva]|uniref:tRNA 4-demethylwyosine synthase (AdoMet-dependent) n=1 Tax=Passalora fulva TaxID=5499 RepID=A0A9Q8USQ6_PASFU|nr:S-adenosyl-L-methionine-dependent tRNA 4-demethylwyosine synthase [Fulvia fulva]KAK4618296.1 S-adenosyl-L-methionine-dependent tRNA 4-demethylwyosine synthase [Fulvia fulva]KAK4619160.1 S-adenosyl-L-methionine-dependent tRNA 4-demethylwyosine synthase [Fulvia fulva]UJO21038.1 S-adenosyl-L-methionine-dependent tRNA 4-demethylwyosine synthase [Fulvia fulva]WPV18507.1 S-adenosyl-L-methionine-dependent tRNA 4-demethylwyosine synthase [Fulvia fulva]WPV32787.1 S-adenosyl-L-methionine-dependent tR
MDPERLLQLPGELLFLWHTHRAEVLLGAAVVIGLLRLAIQWRGRKSKIALTPPLGSPIDEKKQTFAVEHSREVSKEPVIADKVEPAVASKGPRRIKGKRIPRPKQDTGPAIEQIQPYVFYFSLGGSTREHATKLVEALSAKDDSQRILQPALHDLTEIDYEDYFVSPPKTSSPSTANFYMILIPGYNIDTELSNFLSHLEETHHDFRIDTAPLSGLAGYSVFGFGDQSEWPTERDGYCQQAIEVDKWMARLTGRKRAFPLGMRDVKADELEERLTDWRRGVQSVMQDLSQGKGLGEGVAGSGDAVESDDEDAVEYEDDETLVGKPRKNRKVGDDLEDMKAPIPVDFTTAGKSASTLQTPKEMVPKTSPTYTNLTKQGYTIVGSHSGVKICRWTKSALRGRGSCYKYSFYGINSHLCMEATPSLSCSNKCVFCWRHGTNPVGTTWRWQVDPPDLIFDGMKEGHYQKIKMMRGVPGVRSERFSEAMRIRHCALSLVGEPIFYPHINELLAMLHNEHISSFLVCNAQHPDQLAALGPVTQLYVSIDASNKESLRKIDRPLHRDFWERFIRCMDILREKRFTHRTVFRLTLVKGFNIEEEAAGYADLVERALPGFVEVKGVTYCGTSTAAGAGLSMQNVPFYKEVQKFVLALEAELNRRGLQYGIGAEHAHSCCILLADRTRFNKDGRWHTTIDYPAFFKCVESGKPFSPEDYIGAPTHEWALWGNGGFDPRDERVDRKGKPKEVKAVEYPPGSVPGSMVMEI